MESFAETLKQWEFREDSPALSQRPTVAQSRADQGLAWETLFMQSPGVGAHTAWSTRRPGTTDADGVGGWASVLRLGLFLRKGGTCQVVLEMSAHPGICWCQL